MARFLQLNLSVNAAILNCYGPHVVATTDSERLIVDMPVYTAGIGVGLVLVIDDQDFESLIAKVWAA